MDLGKKERKKAQSEKIEMEQESHKRLNVIEQHFRQTIHIVHTEGHVHIDTNFNIFNKCTLEKKENNRFVFERKFIYCFLRHIE